MIGEMRPWRQNGPNGAALGRGMSLFGGFLFPEKRFWRFWGVHRCAACPFLGVSCFRKKGFGVFGGCIGGPRKNVHVPFWGFLIWKKNTVGFNDVFSIIGV